MECRLIYTQNDRDLFVAQSFNAARDRLWQLDLWRRRGLGLLSESVGPGFVARDRTAPFLFYRGDMSVEWNAYGDDAKSWIESLCCEH